jgi:hypothetical protein
LTRFLEREPVPTSLENALDGENSGHNRQPCRLFAIFEAAAAAILPVNPEKF